MGTLQSNMLTLKLSFCFSCTLHPRNAKPFSFKQCFITLCILQVEKIKAVSKEDSDICDVYSNSSKHLLNVYSVPGIVLSVLKVLTHLNLTILWSRLWHLHSTDEETKYREGSNLVQDCKSLTKQELSSSNLTLELQSSPPTSCVETEAYQSNNWNTCK